MEFGIVFFFLRALSVWSFWEIEWFEWLLLGSLWEKKGCRNDGDRRKRDRGMGCASWLMCDFWPFSDHAHWSLMFNHAMPQSAEHSMICYVHSQIFRSIDGQPAFHALEPAFTYIWNHLFTCHLMSVPPGCGRKRPGPGCQPRSSRQEGGFTVPEIIRSTHGNPPGISH